MRTRHSKSQQKPLACLILAAGKGTRMNSARNKVLHTLLGVPMAAYVVERARGAGAATVVTVLGHQKDEVVKVIEDRFGPGSITVVEQKEQKGTGHAVHLGLRPLHGFNGLVAILYGDVPLLRAETLAALVTSARRATARPPERVISSIVEPVVSPSRETAAIPAPAWDNARLTARPKGLPAPVTSATLPFKLNS